MLMIFCRKPIKNKHSAGDTQQISIKASTVKRALPRQQAVVSGEVVILELDHIQIGVVILAGLEERMKIRFKY